MQTDIIIPHDLWPEDGEAAITSWLASDGATVEMNALIAEVMVEKVQYEILAPASGTLSIARQVDEVVSKGDVIGAIT